MLAYRAWRVRRNHITLYQHMELIQCHVLMQKALESVLAACKD